MMRVLVVDDDKFDQQLILRVAKELGMPARVSSMPMSAQTATKDSDILVADLESKSGDAIEFLRELRKVAPNFPILVLTASSRHAAEALEAGASDYLSKPFDSQSLIEALRKSEEALRSAMTRSQFDSKFPAIIFFATAIFIFTGIMMYLRVPILGYPAFIWLGPIVGIFLMLKNRPFGTRNNIR